MVHPKKQQKHRVHPGISLTLNMNRKIGLNVSGKPFKKNRQTGETRTQMYNNKSGNLTEEKVGKQRETKEQERKQER
jgi:hypothetical protein